MWCVGVVFVLFVSFDSFETCRWWGVFFSLNFNTYLAILKLYLFEPFYEYQNFNTYLAILKLSKHSMLSKL